MKTKTPCKPLAVLLLVPLSCSAPASRKAPRSDSAPASRLEARKVGDSLVVMAQGRLFTEYRYGENQKYPYFFPLNGPASNTSVTTESSEPYPHHHSLFFGCDRVNGGNYWQQGLERGRIVQQSLTLEQARGERVAFTTRNRWQRPGAADPLLDERHIRIEAPRDDLRLIDFEITLTALEEVRIQRTNHSLFSARMAPELSVQQGGHLVNAAGAEGEKATFGQHSPWMDYWGERAGQREGLAILDHPKNRWAPTPWFTRDYGFFSPTPMYWLPDGTLRLAPGEQITLRYRVLVHAGSTREAGIDEQFRDWAR